jgi:SAM-dependent methyltransferase
MSTPLPNSPSAERNKQVILDVLLKELPATGRALEIASGTGQHIVHFAAALQGLEWQPTEPGAEDRATIVARVAEAGLANVRAPVELDVLADPWPVDGRYDAIVCINMIHIAPWSATPKLMAGAARHLAPGGKLVLYGPFLENGTAVQSNLDFDGWLKRRNPESGLRELAQVILAAKAAGLDQPRVFPMPANNLTVVFTRAG